MVDMVITLQDHAPLPQLTETPSLGFQHTIDEPPFFMGSFVKKKFVKGAVRLNGFVLATPPTHLPSPVIKLV